MQQIACNYIGLAPVDRPAIKQLHAIVLGSGGAIDVNQCVSGDVISEMSSDEELLLLSRDSTKRCHWLQHSGLMNIFEHV